MSVIEKKVRGARKRSPRTLGKRKISKASETLKALWKTPEFRERMRQRDIRAIAMRKENPERFYRRGVPDGMRKPEADKLWAEARATADRLIAKMKEEGDLPVVVVPGSDDEKAEKALYEACVLALGPGDKRTKLMAINTVLSFTKSKPESKIKLTSKPEDWLAAVAAEAKATDGQSTQP